MTIDVRDKTEIFFDNLLKDVCKVRSCHGKNFHKSAEKEGCTSIRVCATKGKYTVYCINERINTPKFTFTGPHHVLI